MFKSNDVNESQFLNNVTLPQLGETYNGIPKVTSTPLNSQAHSTWKRRAGLSPSGGKHDTPRRYSLSETSPTPCRTNITVSESQRPGPLLASLSFKDNVSLYEETRSQGFAKRIVLYNEEAEKEQQCVTHQEKYSSPGFFPIVHLFKAKPPHLEQQSPKRVKIKLASPEYLRSFSPPPKQRLFEGLSNPKFYRQSSLPAGADTGSTKSVLEALKEISRKRIHTSEEQEQRKESGKRIRTEEFSNGQSFTTSKRSRAESPLSSSEDSPTLKQSQKKLCTYDEFAASKSSTDFSFLTKLEPVRSKRKNTSTSTDSLNTTAKQVKLINAETQTAAPLNKTSSDKPISTDQTDNDPKSHQKKGHPLKVFDDAPLDRIRKSRLAALMGNLAGKDAAMPSGDPTLTNSEALIEKIMEPAANNDLKNEKLTSVLSPPKSTTRDTSPAKSDRHVHFTATTTSSVASQQLTTQTSVSIVAPIVSDSISMSKIKIGATHLPAKTTTENAPSSLFSSPFTDTTSKETSQKEKPVTTQEVKKVVGGFKFDLTTPSSSNTTIPVESFPTTPPKISFANEGIDKNESFFSSKTKPTFTFGVDQSFNLTSDVSKIQSTTATTTTTSNTSSTTSVGFKFGSIECTSVAGTTTASSPSATAGNFSFGNSTFETKTATSTSTPSFSVATTPGGFTFGAFATSTTTSEVSKPFAFTNPSTTASSMFAINKNSVFGTSISKVASFTPSFEPLVNSTNTAPATTESLATTSTPAFGNSQPARTAIFSITPSSTICTTTISFGTPSTNTAPLFGSTSASKTLVFGTTPTTTASLFGNASIPSASGFGTTPITTASVFRTNPTTTTSVFRTTPTPTVSGFGTTPVTTASVFGTTPNTTTSVFGTNSSLTAPDFGTTPVTATSVFGSTPATTASVFGAPSTAFGSTTNSFSLKATPQTTTTAIFGSGLTSSTAFTLADPKPFTFGGASSTNNVFGSTSQNSNFTFGGTSTPACSNNTFGATNPTATFSFNANKPGTSNTFGGLPTTTSSASTFEGASSTFSTPGFGSGSTSFGPAGGAFGQTESKPTFSFGGAESNKTPASATAFGSTNSAFGKPASSATSGFGGVAAPPFGSTTNGFGTKQSTGSFNFASSAAPVAASSSFQFSSGSTTTNEPMKPSFNFTGGAATNPPAFASSSAVPTFGAGTPSFGSSAPTFGAAGPAVPTATGVFNIGAGSSSTTRTRTQLRAKRRT